MESARLAGDVRFVQASSAEIFGEPAESPQTEDTAVRPVNPYGAAKAYAHLAARVCRQRDQHVSSVVLYNHESPRRPQRFVTRKITSTVAAIARGEADGLALGNLDARRDWGWAPDYVDAMVRAARADEPGDYVVATGTAHSVRELVAAAFAAAGIADWEPLVTQDPAFFRPADPTELVGDATRARSCSAGRRRSPSRRSCAAWWRPTSADRAPSLVEEAERSAVLEQPQQVLAVAGLAQRLGARDELVVGEPAHPPGDLLGAPTLKPCRPRWCARSWRRR